MPDPFSILPRRQSFDQTQDDFNRGRRGSGRDLVVIRHDRGNNSVNSRPPLHPVACRICMEQIDD
ncbi:MAG TPA: hypothetical protein DDX19_27315 [Rhodopirellula baltica]|uniref:hypothetical protein n=1 Tax=Rhodopirellula baltica TaxID=265606 RepID=UPI0002EC9661|nr:hypothetical protein [Rhodopirellula baltica]HBE66396.1 hypothetical protein [Rhodopirellula baltica]